MKESTEPPSLFAAYQNTSSIPSPSPSSSPSPMSSFPAVVFEYSAEIRAKCLDYSNGKSISFSSFFSMQISLSTVEREWR